jgi:hypothetical protein
VWRSRTIRFTAKPTKGPKVLRQRDEVSILVAGTAHYKVEEMRTAVVHETFSSRSANGIAVATAR